MKILLSIAMCLVLTVGAMAQDASGSGKKKGGSSTSTPAAAPVAMGKAPAGTMTGTVVDIIDMAVGGSGKVNKAQAQQAIRDGRMLAVLVKNRVYFIVNGDGTSAANKLADLADGNVKVAGRTKSKNGIFTILSTYLAN